MRKQTSINDSINDAMDIIYDNGLSDVVDHQVTAGEIMIMDWNTCNG